MESYRILQKDEKIINGDQFLDCVNNYKGEGVWKDVTNFMIGKEVADPQYPAHTLYRRKVKTQGGK